MSNQKRNLLQLKAVANPIRAHLLHRILTAQALPDVEELIQYLASIGYGKQQPTISNHLMQLYKAHLVDFRCKGRHHHYFCCDEQRATVLLEVAGYTTSTVSDGRDIARDTA